MKFDKNKAFPYPVLRPFSDDYFDVEFQAAPDFIIEQGKVKVKVAFALSSSEIADQIKLHRACFVSVISCRDTYFQVMLNSFEKELSAEFDVGDLRGEVKIDSYIVVVEDIRSFSSPDINPEFGRGPFSFGIGDVLAQDDSSIIYIDRDMFKPVTSVFQLVKREQLKNGEWTVSFDENYIQLGVNADTKCIIDEARNDKKNRLILINSIYFCAVMQAIQKLQDAKETYEHYKWAQIMLGQIHNNNFDLEAQDSYYIAQNLMKLPLNRLCENVFRRSE